jgi:hypothetical protein
MKKAEKESYIIRIHHKLNDIGWSPRSEAERLFRVAMRTHSATVPGNQGRKPSRKIMDEQFKRAFSSILSVIK